MVSLPLRANPDHAPAEEQSSQACAFLNYLRFVSMGCRSKPKADLFEACALLHGDRKASREAHADALMRCLNDTLGKRARLFAPGTTEMTFDEQWLTALGCAIAKQDGDSTEFLLKSRIRRNDQRLIQFLVTRISECFSLI
ncbi:MAG: hypothetical protein AB8B62_14955 [Roseobacter sp.]